MQSRFSSKSMQQAFSLGERYLPWLFFCPLGYKGTHHSSLAERLSLFLNALYRKALFALSGVL